MGLFDSLFGSGRSDSGKVDVGRYTGNNDIAYCMQDIAEILLKNAGKLVDKNKVITLENISNIPAHWRPLVIQWLINSNLKCQVRGDATLIFAEHVTQRPGLYLNVFCIDRKAAAMSLVNTINSHFPGEAAVVDDYFVYNNRLNKYAATFNDVMHKDQYVLSVPPPVQALELYRHGIETPGPTTISFSYNLIITAAGFVTVYYNVPDLWQKSKAQLVHDTLCGLDETIKRLEGKDERSAEKLRTIFEFLSNRTF